MSRRRFLLLTLFLTVPAVLLPAAAVAGWFARPKKTTLTVEVTGTPGLTITGTCEVDGSSRELTGAVPTQFVLEGYRVTYSLVSTKDSGEFRVRALIGDQAYGSAGSASPPKYGVRGWVKSSWWGAPPANWIEPFDKDEQPGWITPPP
jgi:hypothetical protein